MRNMNVYPSIRILNLCVSFLVFLDIVKFDNSYSLRRSKFLDYWVELLEPVYEDEEVGYQEPMRWNPDVWSMNYKDYE